MLLIYQIPVILSVRYGIDIWIWLRSVFGFKGVNVVTILIILVNFPWYAVCCELFADSMENLLGLFGIGLFPGGHLLLSISCVVLGTFIAYRGIGSITWTTRILVPLLLLVGVVVVIVGFTSVPIDVIWNYKPELTGDVSKTTNYILSIEANFAFVITLVGGMAEVPRLCKSEKSGFYAGVLGQGLAGSFFVVVGAVMAIAMHHVTGEMIKKDLSVRSFEIDGNTVQPDLYSAFITGHTLYSSEDSMKPDTVDYESCANDFENYIFLQNKELERLTSEKKLSWYIS
jgi:purine-cytosine permease-like protein